MKFALLAVAFLAQSAIAQDISSDAFGLYLDDDAERETWAGQFQSCLAENCTSKTHKAGEIFNVENYFGQKSLLAGEDVAMALGVFTDRYGNLVKQGTGYFFADSGNTHASDDIVDGVSHQSFFVDSCSDQYLGGVRSKDIQSIAEVYRVVPNLNSVDLDFQPVKSPVRQGNLATIDSGALEDRFGNPAALGTFMQAILIDENGRYTVVPMSSQDGRAKAVISTSTFQGKFKVELNLLNSSSHSSAFEVVPERLNAIGEIEVYRDYETKTVLLHLRGLQTDQDHLVADATQIDLSIIEATGETLHRRVWALEGEVETRIPFDKNSFPVTLLVQSAYGSLTSTINFEDLKNLP